MRSGLLNDRESFFEHRQNEAHRFIAVSSKTICFPGLTQGAVKKPFQELVLDDNVAQVTI